MLHEKLESYRVLLKTAGRISKDIANWPRGSGYLADQLTRAIASSILNLAEGNGRRTHRERSRFFEISRGSIHEAGAAIDIGRAYNFIDQAAHDSYKSDLKLASAMIWGLIKRGP